MTCKDTPANRVIIQHMQSFALDPQHHLNQERWQKYLSNKAVLAELQSCPQIREELKMAWASAPESLQAEYEQAQFLCKVLGEFSAFSVLLQEKVNDRQSKTLFAIMKYFRSEKNLVMCIHSLYSAMWSLAEYTPSHVQVDKYHRLQLKQAITGCLAELEVIHDFDQGRQANYFCFLVHLFISLFILF